MALDSPHLRCRLALVGALTLLSACTLEPRYRTPALPVPDQWPIPATVGTTAGAATTSDAAAPAPPPQAPAQPVDMSERLAQLTQLGELRKAGILTEAEFEQQKARILNG